MKKINELVERFEMELETMWQMLAAGMSTNQDLYVTAEELSSLGISGVYVSRLNGRRAWFNLEEMSF